MRTDEGYVKGMEYLVEVVQQLSLAHTLDEIISITRHAARDLTGADGATFVLREGNSCYYVDEEAIGPLWKGKRFPMESCISGWAMLNRQIAVIEDIYQDPRIPKDAYRPTFVKSLVMVPIREARPIGAIGNYWARNRAASEGEIRLLKALANSTSTALENVALINDLTEAKSRLENALRSRDEFLSVVAHELRTPLAALKLQLQMTDRTLKRKASQSEESEPLTQSLDLSLRQVASLNYLVEQLLDVSRIRLERVQLSYKKGNFSEIVRRGVEQIMPSLQLAGCDIEFDLDNSIVGKWDTDRINQIIANLLSNARKYAAGKPVKISSRDDGRDHVILKIADGGPGIPRQLQHRIFGRFERGVGSENISGLGLGLFITRHLVEAHGGSIRVESGPGPGAEFSVELPINPPLREKTR